MKKEYSAPSTNNQPIKSHMVMQTASPVVNVSGDPIDWGN